jgi:hypothetical protein
LPVLILVLGVDDLPFIKKKHDANNKTQQNIIALIPHPLNKTPNMPEFELELFCLIQYSKHSLLQVVSF